MIDKETKEKIGKLPVWARDLINRLDMLSEPQIDEIVRLRRKMEDLNERLRRSNSAGEAMQEMFRSAAKGGDDYAKAITNILEGYELFPKADSSVEAP